MDCLTCPVKKARLERKYDVIGRYVAINIMPSSTDARDCDYEDGESRREWYRRKRTAAGHHRAFCVRSRAGRDDDAVLCDEPPRRLPSQPRFDFCAALERGLFVTSAIRAAAVPPVARGGEADCCACVRVLRTGVKPAREVCSARRTRGVLAFSWLGTLSAVKTCGGTPSQSSKSSGARRFFPMVDEVDALKGSCSGWTASWNGWKDAFGGA